MIIKDAHLVGYKEWLRFVWKAHISNWFWKKKMERRLTRQRCYGEFKARYFRKFLPFVEQLKCESQIQETTDFSEEKIFTLWFQGRENAPEIVKRCFSLLEKKFGDRLIILDETTLKGYITLPEYIQRKWDNHQIVPANFSDIVRIELLTKYGGYWFDATDCIISDIPDIVKNSDFLVLVTSPTLYTHMFIQSCFIRAKKGDPLIKMWRDTVFKYWETEESSVDYFLVHMLLKFLVDHNTQAKELFEQMPKIYQDHIHLLWYDYGNLPYERKYLEKMRDVSFFQKCSYRPLKHTVKNIIPGSVADIVTGGQE